MSAPTVEEALDAIFSGDSGEALELPAGRLLTLTETATAVFDADPGMKLPALPLQSLEQITLSLQAFGLNKTVAAALARDVQGVAGILIQQRIEAFGGQQDGHAATPSPQSPLGWEIDSRFTILTPCLVADIRETLKALLEEAAVKKGPRPIDMNADHLFAPVGRA